MQKFSDKFRKMKNAKQIKFGMTLLKLILTVQPFFFLICFLTATEFSCKYELYYKEN